MSRFVVNLVISQLSASYQLHCVSIVVNSTSFDFFNIFFECFLALADYPSGNTWVVVVTPWLHTCRFAGLPATSRTGEARTPGPVVQLWCWIRWLMLIVTIVNNKVNDCWEWDWWWRSAGDAKEHSQALKTLHWQREVDRQCSCQDIASSLRTFSIIENHQPPADPTKPPRRPTSILQPISNLAWQLLIWQWLWTTTLWSTPAMSFKI